MFIRKSSKLFYIFQFILLVLLGAALALPQYGGGYGHGKHGSSHHGHYSHGHDGGRGGGHPHHSHHQGGYNKHHGRRY